MYPEVLEYLSDHLGVFSNAGSVPIEKKEKPTDTRPSLTDTKEGTFVKTQLKVPPEEWVEGEWYYRPGGQTAFKMVAVLTYGHYTGKYESHSYTTDDRKTYLIKAELKEGTNTMTLYTWTGKFGTKLAVNSLGEWIMEEKGTGKTCAVNKALVEEVTPYTISVKFPGNSKLYSYLANKNQFEVGYYITDTGIALVTKVDTKSKAAINEFKPIAKFVTEVIKYD